jgi:acetyl esterase
MIHRSHLSPDAFDAANCAPDLARLNQYLLDEHARRPDPWSVTVQQARQARVDGKGIFPPARPDPDTKHHNVPVPGAPDVPVRVIRPKTRDERGTYIHIHGGGWLFGQAIEADPRLRRMAESTGLATVSIDYRLAPEHPFPAAFDDCLAVARAVLDGRLGLPTDFMAIGGESAGAHLSAVTLLRLRDEDAAQPFHATNLVAGFYDLSLTPSARNPATPRIVINATDLARFVELSLPAGGDPRDPRYSPIYADLSGLAPARMSCGSCDPLRHDTLFMAQAWSDSGNETELCVTPGGCHVFESFGTPSGEASITSVDAWLNERIALLGP